MSNTATASTADFVDQVAANVRAMAGYQGVSASQLARAIHMDRSSLGARWRGERQWQLEDLEALGRVFGVEPWSLCGPTPPVEAAAPVIQWADDLRTRRDSNPKPSGWESDAQVIALDMWRADREAVAS